MVRAIMIVEMAGRPAEHLKAALEEHVGMLKNIKEVEVVSVNVSEPKVIEASEKFKDREPIFTCFAEVEFECDRFSVLSDVVFDFMPSSVEIVEPSKIVMDMHEATSLLNNVSGRMHRYDDIARMASVKMKQMEIELKATKEGGVEKEVEKKLSKKKIKKD